MKRHGLGKLYDRLTPEERFKLDVEATARGDEVESRKLLETCPRRSYAATDWGFSGRWHSATELSLFVCLDLCQHLSRLQMLEALKETLPTLRTPFSNMAEMVYLEGHEAGSRYAWKMAQREGDPPGWEPLGEDEEVIDQSASDPQIDKDLAGLEERIEQADIAPTLLQRLERTVAADALSLWEGYKHFCMEELQVEAEKLLAAVLEPVLEGVEKLKSRKQKHGIESADLEEKAREYRVVLSELWSSKRREFERLSRQMKI